MEKLSENSEVNITKIYNIEPSKIEINETEITNDVT